MGANSSCLSETIELVSPFGKCVCKGCSCTCGITSKKTPEVSPATTAPTSPIDIAVRVRMKELEHDLRNQIMLSISPLNTPGLLRSPAQSPDPAVLHASSFVRPSIESPPDLHRQQSVTVPRWPSVPFPIEVPDDPDSRVI